MSNAVESLGIVELVSVCDHEIEWHRSWARALGAGVATSSPGNEQRRLAEASQRHVELAARWSHRRPEIPEAPASAAPDLDAVGADLASYRDDLSAAQQRYQALGRRVDGDLDPSTARTLRLCQREIDDLLGR